MLTTLSLCKTYTLVQTYRCFSKISFLACIPNAISCAFRVLISRIKAEFLFTEHIYAFIPDIFEVMTDKVERGFLQKLCHSSK